MESLLYFAKKLKYTYIIALLLSFFSCDRAPKRLSDSLSYLEKRNLEQFFHQLILQEGAGYTLFGNKPMTEVLLPPKQLSSLDADTALKNFFSFLTKEQRNHSIWREDHLNLGWECWEKIANRFPSNKYLLVKKTLISPYINESDMECLILVNREELKYVLDRYHDDFTQVIGNPFNSLEVINELSSSDSYFWNAVFSHEALTGIVLGYGYMNAWMYHWKKQYENNNNEQGEYFSNLSLHMNESSDETQYPLPKFGYVDPLMRQQYEYIQKKIIEAYKDGDFLEITLRQFIAL